MNFPLYSFNQESLRCKDSLVDLAKRYNNLGAAMLRTNNLDSARYYLETSLSIKNQVYDSIHPYLGNSLVNLGILASFQGLYYDALSYYSKAERHYANSMSDLADLYVNKGIIYSDLSDYDRAEIYFRKAEQLYSTLNLGKINNLANLYLSLGNVFLKKQEPDSAIFYYSKRKKLTKDNFDTKLLTNLAIAYMKKGEPERAGDYFKQSINILEDKKGSSYLYYFNALNNYINLLLSTKKYNLAGEFISKTLMEYDESKIEMTQLTSKTYYYKAQLCRMEGSYDTAVFYINKALNRISDDSSGYRIVNEDVIHQFSSPVDGIRFYQEKAFIYEEKGRMNNNRESLKKSLENYWIAIRLIDYLRREYQTRESKIFLAEIQQSIYRNAVNLSAELYHSTGNVLYMERALQIAEENKAVILREALQQENALQLADVPQGIREKEQKLEKQIWLLKEKIYEESNKRSPNVERIDYWRHQLISFKTAYFALKDSIDKSYPSYYTLKYEIQIPELAQIRKELEDGECILEYALNDSFLHLFYIDKDTVFLSTRENTGGKLFAEIESVRSALQLSAVNNLTVEKAGEFASLLARMYAQLIPEEINQNKIKEIVFIPDNQLFLLPFDILIPAVPGHDEVMNYANYDYLITDYTISYRYSVLNWLPERNSGGKAARNLAAYAPKYESSSTTEEIFVDNRQDYRDQLYALLYTEKEANAVGKIMKGDVYIGDEADEECFKKSAGNYDVLHLAMHALLDNSDPMYSKLAFTKDSDSSEDDLLNTYEIFGLQLACRLAVLSSCSSGVGSYQSGDGIMSLAMGFSYAGCPSILFTLWPVEDIAGYRLMEKFYTNLRKGQNRAVALRNSKLSYLQEADPLRAHPYFWAGYLLMGESEAMFMDKRLKFSIYLSLILLVAAGFSFHFLKKKK